MKTIKLFVAVFGVAFLLSSCTGGQQTTPDETSTNADISTAGEATPLGQASVIDKDSEKNILQIAMSSPDHTTLVAAVQAAEIEHILANNGPLTVFAPTNKAFDALPEGTLDDLLKPENKQKLADILTFHAAPVEYKDKLLKDGMSLYMATGHYVKVERKGDATYVHGAKITGSVDAANGVVHVVDAVMLPPES